ncbi:hypothetical protein [Paraburkholderia pallida]|uniref:Uncharacterized protein n=1 Tax=Paraburkholderia pallida TaxID=2547399 RepID=A0A4P7D3A5_9BURK|nr:hypothetical protein [Paraburkholderia pallida]QBR01737.1 hypothetical protein E1956_31770 [Paraburkholderia pallida]
MSHLAYFTHRIGLRKLDDIGARVERRRARVRFMRTLVIAGALVAVVAVASGWAVAGLAAYVASLAPLIILSW